jgi:parvulin-like peptidyl-prolyl isomerase
MRALAGAILVLAAALPARAGSDAPAAPTGDAAVIATVDGVPITRGEYKEFLVRTYGESALEVMINEMLVRREAKKAGIVVTPQDEKDWIEERLRDMEESGNPAYQGIDKDELRRQYAPHAGIGALIEKVVKWRRTSSDEALKREYDLRFGERRRARHILFQVKQGPDGKPDPAALAAAKKRADETYADLKKGADFGEVAKKVSEDPGSRPEGGELPEFARADMVPEFADKAFSLKEGEISEPVLSQFGWHIIQVTKVIPPAKPLDDATKAELRQEAAKRPLDDQEVRRFLKDIRDAAKVEKAPDVRKQG